MRQTALLLVDVINDFDFPGSEPLIGAAEKVAAHIKNLKEHAIASKIPVIYVNDNFGRWRSDFKAQVQHCTNVEARGRSVALALTPSDDDYFILKPMHSGFYSTNLEVLLEHLNVKKLILTGFAGNICVLFTANDAYMRGYELIVPRDCVASNTAEENSFALQQMRAVLKAEIPLSNDLNKSLGSNLDGESD